MHDAWGDGHIAHGECALLDSITRVCVCVLRKPRVSDCARTCTFDFIHLPCDLCTQIKRDSLIAFHLVGARFATHLVNVAEIYCYYNICACVSTPHHTEHIHLISTPHVIHADTQNKSSARAHRITVKLNTRARARWSARAFSPINPVALQRRPHLILIKILRYNMRNTRTNGGGGGGSGCGAIENAAAIAVAVAAPCALWLWCGSNKNKQSPVADLLCVRRLPPCAMCYCSGHHSRWGDTQNARN